jgi:hypothetical protein
LNFSNKTLLIHSHPQMITDKDEEGGGGVGAGHEAKRGEDDRASKSASTGGGKNTAKNAKKRAKAKVNAESATKELNTESSLVTPSVAGLTARDTMRKRRKWPEIHGDRDYESGPLTYTAEDKAEDDAADPLVVASHLIRGDLLILGQLNKVKTTRQVDYSFSFLFRVSFY